MAKEPYADDIERLSSATRTHFTHFQVGRLPWHTDDHKFGESTDGDGPDADPTPEQDRGDEGDSEPERATRGSVACTYSLVDTGKCYWCPNYAFVGYGGKLYCPDCWSGLEEDREDPYGGGG